MALCIYIDGGARGNPGPAAAGVLIHEGDPSAPLHEGGYFLGRMTNNMAEYQGLLIALELAVQTGADEISVHSDSQLLVRQIEGKYRVQSSLLKPLYEQAKKHLKAFAHWKITHIRREFNVRADALANLAMDAGDDVIVVALSGKSIAHTPKMELIKLLNQATINVQVGRCSWSWKVKIVSAVLPETFPTYLARPRRKDFASMRPKRF